jgi:hypothetical protein
MLERATMLSRLSPRTRAALGWMLAPALAGLAMLVQYVMDVPKAEMLPRDEPQLVGEAGKSPETKAREAKPRKQGSSYVARDDAKRRALRGRWSAEPIESEPTEHSFRRFHEALLRSLITRLRAEVLGSENSQPMQIRPNCRSIRCAIELCGDQALVAGIAARLPGVALDGNSLWHELREIEPTREPPKRDSKQNQTCRRWIVDFAVEGATVGELALGGDEPDRSGSDTN